MPAVILEDGSRVFLEEDTPEARQEAKEALARGSQEYSFVGDIGRGIGAGLVSIPQGLTELGTTGIDLFFDTNITDDVNEYFESIKPEVSGSAGKTAQFITQFGIPGLGTVGLLSKASKAKQILGASLVDGAVATDDVTTIGDVIFDSESDEQRLERLDGSEKASARLLERLGVVGETAGIMLTAPAALGFVGKSAGVLSDAVAPLAVPVVNIASKTAGGLGSLANKAFGDSLRKNFTFTGRNPNELVAQLSAGKTAQLGAIKENVETVFNQVQNTINLSVKGNKLNQTDAEVLAQNIQDFIAPQSKLGFTNPSLAGKELADAANELQQNALKNIKSFEGTGNKIDYKALGMSEDVAISKLLEDARGSANLLEGEILNLSAKQGDDNLTKLFIPDEVRSAIEANQGVYGARSYKAYVDSANFSVSKEQRESAVREIQSKMGVSKTEAEMTFENFLSGPGAKNKDMYSFETPEMLLEGLKFGSLKGRKLNEFPEVRKALGEITGYGAKDWKQALRNTALASQITMSKLGSLVAKSKMFDDIRMLDENAAVYGNQKFLKDFSKDLGVPPDQLQKTFVNPEDGLTYVRFNEDAGALKGLYATETFHNSIMGATTDFLANAPALVSQSYKGLLALKAGTQYGKTVLSPTTQIRNFTSIPFFSLMNGNLGPSGRFVDSVKTIFAGLRDPGSRALKKDIIKEGKDYGIIQRGGATLDEIKALTRYAEEDSPFIQKITQSEFAKKGKKLTGIETFEKAYTMSDDTARYYNWNAEQAKLARAIEKSGADDVIPVGSARASVDLKDLVRQTDKGPVIRVGDLTGDNLDKFLKAEAAEIALNTVPTYSRVPDAVKAMKYFPLLGNFIAFPSEIIRNTFNTLARASKEMASGNAELAKIGSRRIAGAFTVTTGLPIALTNTANALTGVDQEKVDAYKRSFAAPWDKASTLIPVGSDENGNPTGFYNFSYTNPYDYLQRPVRALMMEIEKGNRNEASLMDVTTRATFSAFQELFSPFYEPSLGINSILQAYNGETDTGRRIWTNSDNSGEKVVKGLVHIIDEIAPSVVPYNISVDPGSGLPLGIRFDPKDIVTATSSIFGGTDGKGDDKLINRQGRKIDPAETLVQAFSGLKVIKPQIEKSLRYKGFQTNDIIRDSSNQFNRVLRSADERSADEFLRAYINANQDRYNGLRDLYTAIEDAYSLGLDYNQINTELKNSKVANRDLVMKNLFKPMDLNKDLISQALYSNYQKARQPVPVEALEVARQQMSQESLVGALDPVNFIQPQDVSQQPSQTQGGVLRDLELRKLLGISN